MARRKITEKGAANGDADSAFSIVNQVREHGLRVRLEQSAAASKARSEMLAALIANSGREPLRSERQLRRDWESMTRWAASQHKAVLPILKQQRARQRQALRTIVENRERFEYRKGNPQTSICMWRAAVAPNVAVIVQSFSEGVAQVTSFVDGVARTGDNTVRFSAEAKGIETFNLDPARVGAIDLATQHVFRTTAPHDGMLSVTATYAPLGTIFLGVPSDFLVISGAGADIRLFIQVRINPGKADSIDVPFGDTLKIADGDVDNRSGGSNKLMTIGATHAVAHQLSQDNLVEVHGGDVIEITAGFDTFMAASGLASALLFFRPAPLGFNVPMVLARISG